MARYAIERQKLSDRVVALLEDEIVRGVRPLGDQLPSEREMMRLFGVGRPAIREALFALRRKGLVKVGNGTRARVTQPTPAAILGRIVGRRAASFRTAGRSAALSRGALVLRDCACALCRAPCHHEGPRAIGSGSRRQPRDRYTICRHSRVPTLIFTSFLLRSRLIRSFLRSMTPWLIG